MSISVGKEINLGDVAIKNLRNLQKPLIFQGSAVSMYLPLNKVEKMFRGVVKWFDPEKGFGFIRESGTGTDFYVHFSEILTNGRMILSEGQEVSFEKREAVAGIEAVSVRVLS